jgi:hypothetical protein
VWKEGKVYLSGKLGTHKEVTCDVKMLVVKTKQKRFSYFRGLTWQGLQMEEVEGGSLQRGGWNGKNPREEETWRLLVTTAEVSSSLGFFWGKEQRREREGGERRGEERGWDGVMQRKEKDVRQCVMFGFRGAGHQGYNEVSKQVCNEVS